MVTIKVGFPHSGIPDQSLFANSPRLHRKLQRPSSSVIDEHPGCALVYSLQIV